MIARVFFRRGKRVGLCLLHEDDVPFLLTHMNDPEITQFLKRRFPVQWQEERDFVARVLKGSHSDFHFGIALLESGELIGMMGLHRVHWINRTATTGAWIAGEANRGKGYGSEAKDLLLEYAFKDLGLRKICSNVLATNARSRRYNEKCGYHVEGTCVEHVLVDGVFVDQWMMAVFKKDWEALKKRKHKTKKRCT